MRPIDILKVLDLSAMARKQNRTFNPLFAGDAGLGKSEICQAWVETQQKTDPSFGFIDLRLAYREGPDFIGLPEKVTENGMRLTINYLPNFWPKAGTKGLLLLEEPNRANSSVMNCLMQLLTDRKVDDYELPDGWIIAAAINEDKAGFDVNSMDSALSNRFVQYKVEYDGKSFIKFMKDNEWHPSIISYVESGLWQYKSIEEVSETGKYVSPRSFSQLNAAEQTGMLELDTDLHFTTSSAILGTAVGREYYKFRFEQTPVLAQDLIKNKKAALKKLKGYCDDKEATYKGDMVAATIASVLDQYPAKIDDKIMVEVAKIIPKDQAAGLLRDCVKKSAEKDPNDHITLKKFIEMSPDLAEALKQGLRKDKAEKIKETKKTDDDI
jgi:hypothetical protein